MSRPVRLLAGVVAAALLVAGGWFSAQYLFDDGPGYQLAGEVCVRLLGLSIPGPVMGMLFLLLTLALRGGAPTSLEVTATTLLKHLSLLFVPAGVGVIVHLNRISSEWLPILAALVLSTVISLTITALMMRLTQHLVSARKSARD